MSVEKIPPDVAQAIHLAVIDKLVGKPIFHSDTMKDLVNRHCPEVYELAKQGGCEFVPDDTEEPLLKSPPDLRWEVRRQTH